MRYIAVVHGWHVSSNGFDVHELKATTKDEAHDEAKVITFNRNSTFDKCAYTLVEIEDEETCVNTMNHKLSKIPMWIRRLFNAD